VRSQLAVPSCSVMAVEANDPVPGEMDVGFPGDRDNESESSAHSCTPEHPEHHDATGRSSSVRDPRTTRVANHRHSDSGNAAPLARQHSAGISVDSSSSDEEVRDWIQENVENDHIALLAEAVAEMRATREDIVRATRTGYALLGLGRPFWSRRGEFWRFSEQTDRISSFWSHSWHGSTWMKVTTLFFLHNATPAFILSNLAVLLSMVLVYLQVLPSLPGAGSWYCVYIGCPTQILTILFWQRRPKVFVDRVCIHQSDPQLKMAALFSLGAILKSSEEMLVLWDKTYVRRLWCIFEISAFLGSTPEGEKARIAVRPTILGPLLLLLWAGVALIVGTFHPLLAATATAEVAFSAYFWLAFVFLSGASLFTAVHLARRFCREVRSLHNEMAEFRFDKAFSYCCSVGHRNPVTGDSLICDRQIVRRCVCEWFGSVEAFEARVHSEVSSTVMHQLTGELVTYWRVVQIAPGVLWLFLDFSVSNLRDHGVYVYVFAVLGRGLTFWLAVIPTLVVVIYRLLYIAQDKWRFRIVDAAVTLSILFCGLLLLAAFVVIDNISFAKMAGLSNSISESIHCVWFAWISGFLCWLAWRFLEVKDLDLNTKGRVTRLSDF